MAAGTPDPRLAKPSPLGLQMCAPPGGRGEARLQKPEEEDDLVYMQCCGRDSGDAGERRGHGSNHMPVFLPQSGSELGWTPMSPMPTTTLSCPVASRRDYSFRSPESVEMDEIMAAMVLTSLSCSPVVQSTPQREPYPALGDMECGGGELSDSGSSGYWSWDHGNGSPAPSPSVTEVDSSTDEGLHMELEQGEGSVTRRYKSSGTGAYRCLWPNCGKVLTSLAGMKCHIRMLHLGSGSKQTHREEDFYYTKISAEVEQTTPSPSPVPSSPFTPWSSCGSPPGPVLQIPLGPSPGPIQADQGPVQAPPFSQSAPSSFWQIRTEHLYPACTPVQVTMSPGSPNSCCWSPTSAVRQNNQMAASRCRSFSVGEQWLLQNTAPSRPQPMGAPPSRTHCSYRKGRGEAKKCRKVYGVEHRDQWCTSCRWKKACQRFPD